MPYPEWMKSEEKSVLLLEGNDDCNIVNKFCQDNDINKNSFGFYNCGNDSKVLSKLNSLLTNMESDIIGIILDADTDIKQRYQQIKNELIKKELINYKLPTNFPKTGLIVEQENLPKLGIWIMPNNQDNGALEEFYLELADIEVNFIDDVITQAKDKNLASFKSQHKNKAIMHTYFAWQDKPGAPLYSVIDKIALNCDKENAKNFKIWIENLFS